MKDITEEYVGAVYAALGNIYDGLSAALAGIGRLRQAVRDFSGLAAPAPAAPPSGPKSLVDKFPAEFEASRPKTQPELPGLDRAPGERSHRVRLGDFGFEDEFNPVRQAVGQAGGLATAGVARAPSPDRRAPGTVMVKLMTVNEKRRYWRWAKDRSKARALGHTPPSWPLWASLNGITA